MNNLTCTIPGYKVYEYLLVLNPNEELRSRIMQVKRQFFETYRAENALYSKPYLAFAGFVQYQIMEYRLVNRLKTIAMGYHPFKIEMKDYGSFPSHTIFINITSKLPVQNLVKQVRSEAQRLMKLNDENKPHFIMEPYIAIARKLLPWQYEKGWPEYRNKHFKGRFIADAMLLLKRPVGEKKYQVAERFDFQNLPVTTTQGILFD